MYTVVGEPKITFNIKSQAGVSGMRIRFVLDQGDPRTKSLPPRIEIGFNVWHDPNEPWRQSLTSALPIIELNINVYTPLRQALDWEHTDTVDMLIAEYVTAAIMEARKESNDHSSRIRQSNLFAIIYQKIKLHRTAATQGKRKPRRA